MGAIVLSGARIGAGSLVGAGALVREGQEIPPGTLAVGAPARVIGPVNDDHRAAIARGTSHYVALSREYLGRGFGQRVPAVSGRGALGDAPRAMTFGEWGALVAALAEAPVWAAARLAESGDATWRRRPGPESWCAQEVVRHLFESDTEVFAPRLERLLSERRPEFVEVDLNSRHRGAPVPAESAADLIERWRLVRLPLLARLATLGPAEWARTGSHSRGGPYPLADMVRGWVEHELSHRRQLERALGAGA
jgi:hypothetical protein